MTTVAGMIVPALADHGRYDARKSHPPVLAICGQVPLAEIGSDFFQEVDNDVLFSDVAVFTQTVVDETVRTALAHPDPTLLDVVTNAQEVVLPPKTGLDQAWGFAVAKFKESLVSHDAD